MRLSIKTLAARMTYLGGDQLSRINKQKKQSFHWALKNDYNSRKIATADGAMYYALINVNNLKANYDKEYVSVDFDAGLQPGDVFTLLDNNTHWMIYLPIMTETAYLRSEIIRCNYTLTIDDEIYWIYFRGPEETDIRWFIKSGININELNYSGTIYIKNTPTTKAFFERFTHIKVDGHIWEVQVTDSISVPGIIELEVQEYYDNPIAELPEIVRGDNNDIIIGDDTVKQDSQVGYYIPKTYLKNKYKWEIIGNPRVKILEVLNDGSMCKVQVYAGAVGTYTVKYGDYTLDVKVDWERSYIKGPDKVSPYGFYTYKAKGTFSIDSDLVKIVKQDGISCEVEIVTGRKGNFILQCETAEGEIKKLPVTIGSLTGGNNEKKLGVVS